MKKAIFLYTALCLCCVLAGCGGSTMPQELRAVDAVVNEHPDSALVMLDSLESQRAGWGEDARMRYDLLRLKALNKTYVDFTSDSLPRVLVDYYRRHGSRNDRVQSLYLLGRAYHSLGDAPMALQTYFEALDEADTLSADCDFDALRGIYGQMAVIFHDQNLPHDEIRALRGYIDCTRRTRSEKEVIIEESQLIRPYWLLGMKDSVVQICLHTQKALKRLGEPEGGQLVILIYIYTERGELEKARETISLYESDSTVFDKQGNIAKGREGYYFIRGFYELTAHRLDSAEYYYRKAMGYGYLKEGSQGLMKIYRERRDIDSVAKYSLLYEEAQDSLNDQLRTETIHQMSALYDYTRSQQRAEQEAARARTARAWTWAVIVAAVLIVGLIVRYHRRSQARKRQEIRRLAAALSSARVEHESVQDELSRLKARDYEGLIAEKERREKELQQVIDQLQQDVHQPKDRLIDFADSEIAQLFRRKSEQKTERPIPTEAEWRLLERQFCQDMPAAYDRFTTGRKLSPLEQRTCILLMLGYSESTIAKMTEKSPQAITTAKTRANDKLFGQHEAHSLKGNLMRGV